MKHITRIILGCALLVAGCKKERTPAASPHEADAYARADIPGSPLDHHIYTVYQQTGVPILYSDTLRQSPLALLNINYLMTGSDNLTLWRYTHDTAALQAGVTFVEQRIIPALGGHLKPHAILLADAIISSYWTTPDGEDHYITENAYQGLSAMAIGNMTQLKALDAVALQALQRAVFYYLLKNALNNQAALLTDFYAASAAYYYGYVDMFHGYSQPFPEKETFGFLSDGSESPDYGYYMRDKSYDLQRYLTVYLATTDEAFTQQYGAYPLVMRKYQDLKMAMTSIRFKKP